MAKIKFDADGTESGSYEVTYNPVEISVPQSKKSNLVKSTKSLDGESILFTPYFDTRRGKLIWKAYPADTTTTVGNNFDTMLSILENLVFPATNYNDVDGYTYMHFGDISDALNVYGSYTKVKVVSLDRTIRSGGAIIFDSVELVFENAE